MSSAREKRWGLQRSTHIGRELQLAPQPASGGGTQTHVREGGRRFGRRAPHGAKHRARVCRVIRVHAIEQHSPAPARYAIRARAASGRAVMHIPSQVFAARKHPTHTAGAPASARAAFGLAYRMTAPPDSTAKAESACCRTRLKSNPGGLRPLRHAQSAMPRRVPRGAQRVEAAARLARSRDAGAQAAEARVRMALGRGARLAGTSSAEPTTASAAADLRASGAGRIWSANGAACWNTACGAGADRMKR